MISQELSPLGSVDFEISYHPAQAEPFGDILPLPPDAQLPAADVEENAPPPPAWCYQVSQDS